MPSLIPYQAAEMPKAGLEPSEQGTPVRQTSACLFNTFSFVLNLMLEATKRLVWPENLVKGP